MILRTSKKVIFTTLIFFNFIQPLNSADYQKINKSKNLFTNSSALKISNNEIFPKPSNQFNNNLEIITKKKDSDPLFPELIEINLEGSLNLFYLVF